MDVAFTLTGLIEEFTECMDTGDFEGAEMVLSSALSGPASQFEPFLHFQFGRLYRRWNKMTSAVNHLNRAAELAHGAKDEIFLLQVLEELKAAKSEQAKQKP